MCEGGCLAGIEEKSINILLLFLEFDWHLSWRVIIYSKVKIDNLCLTEKKNVLLL